MDRVSSSKVSSPSGVTPAVTHGHAAPQPPLVVSSLCRSRRPGTVIHCSSAVRVSEAGWSATCRAAKLRGLPGQHLHLRHRSRHSASTEQTGARVLLPRWFDHYWVSPLPLTHPSHSCSYALTPMLGNHPRRLTTRRAGQGVTRPNMFRAGEEHRLPLPVPCLATTGQPSLARVGTTDDHQHKQLHALGSSVVVMFPSSPRRQRGQGLRKVVLGT
ncbi:hypothetical protein E2C01_073860 [Portunus trituberculatus]|uniref:Uncharacterized protein n=1 Tax=Portunus trituberculatus TaxID=210409 RepID=A0A5B7ICS4_PORTR|nr:hypothetical protein [Portunus trituberculatus]